jgi:hypothetical protein
VARPVGATDGLIECRNAEDSGTVMPKKARVATMPTVVRLVAIRPSMMTRAPSKMPACTLTLIAAI